MNFVLAVVATVLIGFGGAHSPDVVHGIILVIGIVLWGITARRVAGQPRSTFVMSIIFAVFFGVLTVLSVTMKIILLRILLAGGASLMITQIRLPSWIEKHVTYENDNQKVVKKEDIRFATQAEVDDAFERIANSLPEEVAEDMIALFDSGILEERKLEDVITE